MKSLVQDSMLSHVFEDAFNKQEKGILLSSLEALFPVVKKTPTVSSLKLCILLHLAASKADF